MKFLLLFLSALAFADKPLSVREYKALRLGQLTSISNGHYRNEVTVEGYGLPGFQCPPCPEGAQCGPCPPDYFIVSDKAEACAEKVAFINSDTKSCDDELVVPLERTPSFKPEEWKKGTRVSLNIEITQRISVRNIDTAQMQERRKEDFKENKKWGELMKKSLDNNPNLKKGKRPEWLKDVPGDSYELKKK